jgi:hypothetical protein
MRILNKLKLHQINHTFTRLGFWYVPAVSIPLLLFLFSVQSAPPSPQPKTSIAPNVKRFPANPLITAKPEQRSVKLDSPQANLAAVVTKKQPQAQAPSKSQAKTQKHIVATKTPTPKPKQKLEPKYSAPAIGIRVAIAIGAKELAIASSTPVNILDANQKVVQQLPATVAFFAQPMNSSITVGDWQLPAVVWVEPSAGGAVYVGDRWYRGRLLLVSQGNTLLAINYVDLEQYLASVVGSEMSASEPLEALKGSGDRCSFICNGAFVTSSK